jgi:hypothetical protein
MLGVMLSTSSDLSLLCSGVYGCGGTVFPLGLLVGVDLQLDASLSLGLKLNDADLCVRRLRLPWPGVEESILAGVAVPESRRLVSDALVSSLDPTTLIVGVEGLDSGLDPRSDGVA